METDVAIAVIARHCDLDPAELAEVWPGLERGHVAPRHRHVVRQLVAKLKEMLPPARRAIRVAVPEQLILRPGLN